MCYGCADADLRREISTGSQGSPLQESRKSAHPPEARPVRYPSPTERRRVSGGTSGAGRCRVRGCRAGFIGNAAGNLNGVITHEDALISDVPGLIPTCAFAPRDMDCSRHIAASQCGDRTASTTSTRGIPLNLFCWSSVPCAMPLHPSRYGSSASNAITFLLLGCSIIEIFISLHRFWPLE